jgi:hypothetical protein
MKNNYIGYYLLYKSNKDISENYIFLNSSNIIIDKIQNMKNKKLSKKEFMEFFEQFDEEYIKNYNEKYLSNIFNSYMENFKYDYSFYVDKHSDNSFNDLYNLVIGICKGNVQAYISMVTFILELFDKDYIFDDKLFYYNSDVINKNIHQMITDYWIIKYNIDYEFIEKKVYNNLYKKINYYIFKSYENKERYFIERYNDKLYQDNYEKVNYIFKYYRKNKNIKIKNDGYGYELDFSTAPNISNLIKKDFVINVKDTPGVEYNGRFITIGKISKNNLYVFNYLSRYSISTKQYIDNICIDFYTPSFFPVMLHFYKTLLSTPSSFQLGKEYGIITDCDYDSFINLTKESYTFFNTHYDEIYYKIYKDYYSFRKSFSRDFKVQYFYNSFVLSATFIGLIISFTGIIQVIQGFIY